MKHIYRLFFSALALIGIVSGQVSGVMAQGGSGLQLSPTKTELTVEAGASETFNVQLTNVTSGSITAEPIIYDFTPKDDGSPLIITDEKAGVNPSSIKSFVRGLTSIKLSSGSKSEVNLTVVVPKGQAAGSYYGVILFNANVDGEELNNDTTGGKVALSAAVGHIVLIQVPGNITDKMQLIDTVAGRKDKDDKVTTGSIFSAVPNQIQITVRNTGNSILRPFGTIAVEKGGKTVANIQLNNTNIKASVLPNSNRVFTEELNDLQGFGRFTVTTNISYGNGGDILTSKQNIWVIPVWLGAGMGAGAVAIAAVIFVAVRKFRR